MDGELIEFIPKDVYERDYDIGGKTSKTSSRRRVAQSFIDVFDGIGGTARMAQWAEENQTEFYRLYAKLLPSPSSKDDGDENKEVIIRHVLPRTALDE